MPPRPLWERSSGGDPIDRKPMQNRLRSRGVITVALLAALAMSPVQAATPRVQVDAHTLLALGARLEGSGRKQEAAQVYHALESDPDSAVRSEARFRMAKLLAAEGRTKEAAVLLRHVIDDYPEAAPPRLELIALLQQIGDEGTALRELRSIGTLDLPLNVARLVDRMSASLRASRPFSFQLEVGLAPDTNINQATTSDALGTVFGDFTFDNNAKARSGVGGTVRAFVQGRMGLTSNLALKAHGSLNANLYRHADFNNIALELAAGPEFHLGPARFVTEIGVGQQWYGMQSYQRSWRLSGSGWASVGRSSQLRLDTSARWVDNKFNHLQDGVGLALATRYERALSPRLTISLGASVDRFKARDDAYSTKSWAFAVGAYRDVGRTTLDIGGEHGGLKADDRLALLPQARKDRMTRVHVGAVFRNLTVAGFAPTMRLVIERNRSTVEYYDYKRRRAEFGVSRAF